VRNLAATKMLLFSSWRSQGATSLFFDRLSNLKAKRTGHGLYCFRVINSSLAGRKAFVMVISFLVFNAK